MKNNPDTLDTQEMVRKMGASFLAIIFVFVVGSSLAMGVFAAETRPTITGVSPSNNYLNSDTDQVFTVTFSEPMNPDTINDRTFYVTQNTAPREFSQTTSYRSREVDGVVTYQGLTATFTPFSASGGQNPLQPSQEYGNVFTATVTTGAQDLDGNSLARDYMWSVTTGLNPFAISEVTTQTDQSALATDTAPVTTPATTPPVTTEETPLVAPAQSAPSTSFPWFWVIIAVALLLLILTAFMLAGQSKQKTRIAESKVVHKTTTNYVNRSSPFGDVHSVGEIEGIGPKYAESLANIGIFDTKELWNADAAKVAHSIGVPVSVVRSWQHMAELSSIKDIGPQFAELLERSGVHTIENLSKAKPDALLTLVTEKEDSLNISIQGRNLGRSTVANWIEQARSHRYHRV